MSNQLENDFYREIGLTGTLDDMRKQFYSTDGAGMVRAETNPVTGGIEIIGPSGDAVIVIEAAAPDDEDGRADGVIYIQTEA